MEAASAGDGDAEEFGGVADEGGEVEGEGGEGAGLGLGERLELAGEVDGLAGGGADLLEAVAGGGIDLRGEEAEFGVALDGGEEVVVVVGDAAEDGGEDLVGVDLGEAAGEAAEGEAGMGLCASGLEDEEAGGELRGLGGEGEEVVGAGIEGGLDGEAGIVGAGGEDGEVAVVGGANFADHPGAVLDFGTGPDDAEGMAVEGPSGVVGDFDLVAERLEGSAQRSAARCTRIEEEDDHSRIPGCAERRRFGDPDSKVYTT